MASCRVYKHQHLALPKMFSEVLGVIRCYASTGSGDNVVLPSARVLLFC